MVKQGKFAMVCATVMSMAAGSSALGATVGGAGGWSYAPGYTPLANDLANVGQASLASTTLAAIASDNSDLTANYIWSGSGAKLNDGLYVESYYGTGDPDASNTNDGAQVFNGDANWDSIATYTIALTAGYDIETVAVLSGSNSGNMAKHNYKLEIASVGSSSWTTVFESLPDLGPHNRTGPRANASIVDFAAGEATNIDRIRLTFLQVPADTEPDAWTTDPWIATVYREIDVVGTITVPEPSALGLLGAGAISCLRRRRR